MNRTTFITAASVGGVVIAGAAVIGANFGILNAADASTPLGDLSVASPAPSYAEAGLTQSSSIYQVAQAGTVEVIDTGTGLVFGEVVPAAGWTWTPTTEGVEATGFFESETESLQFVAQLSSGVLGAAVASVDPEGTVGEQSPIAASSASAPSTSTTPASPATTSTSAPSDDTIEAGTAAPATEPIAAEEPADYQPDDEYEHEEDDEHDEYEHEEDEDDEDEDEDNEDDEHEGRDDDD